MRYCSSAPSFCRSVAITALGVTFLVTPAVSAQAADSATRSGASPVGNVDRVELVDGGVRVFGWAWDPDSADAVTVEISSGSTTIEVTADERRRDVPREFREAGGHHGFDTVLEAAPGRQEICVRALDLGGDADTALSCTSITVPRSDPFGDDPFGNVDWVRAVEGGARVFGWVADMDTVDPVEVAVTVDGQTHRTTGDLARPDVPRVWPGAGDNRGYDTVVDLPAGRHEVCVVGIDVGPGSDRSFGCHAVTVAGRATEPEPAPGPEPAPERQAKPAPKPGPEPAPEREAKPAPKPAPEPKPKPKPEREAKPAPRPQPERERGRADKPGRANTGVPSGVRLERHDGDLVVRTPGAVIDGLDVRGFVVIEAPDVTIKNSIIRGRPVQTSSALVAVRSPRYSLTIMDSELAPLAPSPYIDGLHGQNITGHRLDIHSVIDSVHIFGGDVLIEDSWLHDNAHFAKDPRWGGGPSHDDNVQIQRGADITLRNNSLSGSRSAAIMLTQDSGAVSDVRVHGNWLDGGACVVNIKRTSSAPRNISLRDNTFGRNAIYPGCGIKVPASYPLDLQRNVFTTGAKVKRTP